MEGKEQREHSGDDSGSVYEDDDEEQSDDDDGDEQRADEDEGGDDASAASGDGSGDDSEGELADVGDEDGENSAGGEAQPRPDVTDNDISERVANLLEYDCCRDKCLANKEDRTHNFVAAYMKMTKDCQRTCLVTTLALCQPLTAAQQQQAPPQRSAISRSRYAYYLPIVGSVCKPAFQACFSISNDTLAKQVVLNLVRFCFESRFISLILLYCA